jgi:uncharacterized protein YndB with AHSA1/START domain
MANPLQELSLSPYGFQIIQEVLVESPPEKTWKSLLNLENWFGYDPDPAKRVTFTLEPKLGGRWISKSADGTEALHGEIVHLEPKKLLRVRGAFGLTHLPATSVVIFELQPKNDGKATLLRLGHRTYGYMDPGVQQRYTNGWGKFLPLLKGLAEKN